MMKRALFPLALAIVGTCMPALADQALAAAKNCLACHAIDKKLVGPAYVDVATKYAGQKDAVDKLAVKILKGGAIILIVDQTGNDIDKFVNKVLNNDPDDARFTTKVVPDRKSVV